MGKIVKRPKMEMVLPDMIKHIAPVEVPQRQYKTGLLHGWYHNCKLEQMDKESELQARIAMNKERALISSLNVVREMTTFMAKTQMEFKRVEHEDRMMESEFTEKNLKNQLLYFEVQKAEFENNQMLKEAGDNGETIDI